MTLKIETGKFYRTRDGQKASPSKKINPNFWHVSVNGLLYGYLSNGQWEDDPYMHGNAYMNENGCSDFDLVAEWADEPETPKLWGDMTPEEKGALLLAQHEEKEIEVYSAIYSEWAEKIDCEWRQDMAYRVRPEPKRETVTLWAHYNGKDVPVGKVDLLDGKPDLDSLVM